VRETTDSMRTLPSRLVVSAFALFLGVLLILSDGGLVSAAEKVIPKPSQKEKCPVCGMFVSRYPDWTGSISFRDGSHVYFDGSKDMFKYYFDVKRYTPQKNQADIVAMLVMDYYALSSINARSAFYVIGSDVYGPMGKELIAFEKESDALEFMKDHKGKAVLRFSEINQQTTKGLD
jgi:copper chaperone NosL